MSLSAPNKERSSLMECTATKKWNPEEAPICVEIVCPIMPKLENGNTKCSDENRHQSVCRFVCGEGNSTLARTNRLNWEADLKIP